MKKSLCFSVLLFVLCLLHACDDGSYQRLQLEELERQNRADSLMTNDSLALSLAQWFDRHGTSNEQMRAHYILGRTYADLGEAPAALESYHNAIDRADTTAADCDYAKLSRVHAQKAEVFYYQLLPDNMIQEERLAMRYAQMAKDTLQFIGCYAMMAEGYDMKDILDSALFILTEAHRLYKQSNHEALAASLCCSLADVYLRKGNGQGAKDALLEFEAKTGFFDSLGNIEQGREVYYYIKGLSYLYFGQIDSAEYCFRKELATVRDANNQMAAYKGLQKVYENKKNLDSLVKYSNSFIEAANYSHNEMEMQTLLRLKTVYDYSRNERIASQKALEAKTWGYRFWMTVACSLILILICIMVVAHLRSTIRRYELEKRLRSAAVVIRLKEQARHNPPESPTFQDWKDLRSLVHKEIPSFYYSLNTEDYTLTDMEYDVCLLRRVHMTPTEIYKLKKCSSSYVSTLRIRLLYRVFGKRGTPNDFDDLLFAIR